MRVKRIEFYIEGNPMPAGSKRYVGQTDKGKARIIDDCKKSPAWKNRVHRTAKRKYKKNLIVGPVRLDCKFFMERPKGHYGKGKNAGKIKRGAPIVHLQKPDRTKLLRAVEDGLTGAVWRDDCQVIAGEVEKYWIPFVGFPCGVWIRIIELVNVKMDTAELMRIMRMTI